MLQIKDTLVSLDLLEVHFCCQLAHCKGACCIEGDSGAPLESDEVAAIEAALPAVWDELSEPAKEVIRNQGVSYEDVEGERVTSIVQGKDCVFTVYDEKGICYCALEKAWREGRQPFQKPISCHLYPVRIKQYKDFVAVNYQHWHICSSALDYGKSLGLPLYRFLKEPLIRKFGNEWYEELTQAAALYEQQYKQTE